MDLKKEGRGKNDLNANLYNIYTIIFDNEKRTRLTWSQFDLQGCADQSHQSRGEVYTVVICNGHVHFHQPLGYLGVSWGLLVG